MHKRIVTPYDDLTYQVTGCPLGLLINFGERSLRFRRILPPRNVQEHKVNRQWLFVPNWLRQTE
ncbi:MAG: hypothetical protein P8074_08550 [Anaerolineales bacterium]|jgi:hypothetical protein